MIASRILYDGLLRLGLQFSFYRVVSIKLTVFSNKCINDVSQIYVQYVWNRKEVST